MLKFQVVRQDSHVSNFSQIICLFKLQILVCFLLMKQSGVFAATTAQSICDTHGKVGLFPNPDDGTCKQ